MDVFGVGLTIRLGTQRYIFVFTSHNIILYKSHSVVPFNLAGSPSYTLYKDLWSINEFWFWFWFRLLGVASVGLAPSQPDWCRHLAGLDANQAALCERHPEAMPSVRLGARLGIHECQVQFRHERWNCTLHTTANHSTFDSLIGTGSLRST